MAGNQGNQGCGEFILDCVKCAAAPANAEVKTDIKSSPTTVAAAVSASAAAFATAAKAAAFATAAKAAAFATAAKAIASAAAAASVTNPASAAALDATAATAGAAAIASAAATAAAAAADGVPALVATFANAAAASAADPGNQNLNNLSKVAEDAVSAALLYTNTCAAAADAAATDAAAALAHSNLSAPPYLEPGSGYISCNGIVKCRGKVGPWVCGVVKFFVGVVILGCVTLLFMKMVSDGKRTFGKKGGK